jgi:peptidyl-prolyl cis-trans isomerase D
MFEFVRKHTRILQFILVLLIFPSFVFFGIQGYSGFSEGGNATVATIGREHKITQTELDAAHRRQIDMLRAQMPGIDVKMFDSPQMKRNTLDSLVRERVLLTAGEKAGYVTTDERLLRDYMTDRQFDSFRRPDGSLNVGALEQALAAQGLTKQGFDKLKRDELVMRQVQAGLVGTAFAPAAAASGAIDAMFQQREVQLQRFDTKDYLSKVNPSAADIEAYYKNPAHTAEFQTQEKADVEYVVLDLESMMKGIKVPEDELKKYYSENEKNYSVPEERRASHILIKAAKDQPADERAKARAKADALHADLLKNPAAFAELARKNSQDPGSAEKGGEVDLFIGRNDTDKAYEDALFGMKKPGDLSPVTETKEGFFILQLKAVRGGDKRSFESVREEIEQLRKKQLAQVEFAKAATEFTNLVYEQADSLKPAVDKLKLELRTEKAVTRNPRPDGSGPLASKKLLDALFSADALRNKRNTEAVETGANTLVSARITQYTPAATPPLAEVSTRVREKVVAIQAAALARKEGEARLAALKQAPATDLGTPLQVVSRAQAKDAPRPVIDAVLKAPTATLPAVTGVELGDDGFVVARVVKVLGRDPVAADATRAAAQYAQTWAAAEAQAYYAALKSRFKVEVNLPVAAEAGAGK